MHQQPLLYLVALCRVVFVLGVLTTIMITAQGRCTVGKLVISIAFHALPLVLLHRAQHECSFGPRSTRLASFAVAAAVGLLVLAAYAMSDVWPYSFSPVAMLSLGTCIALL